jgi:hypothetical protein
MRVELDFPAPLLELTGKSCVKTRTECFTWSVLVAGLSVCQDITLSELCDVFKLESDRKHERDKPYDWGRSSHRELQPKVPSVAIVWHRNRVQVNSLNSHESGLTLESLD